MSRPLRGRSQITVLITTAHHYHYSVLAFLAILALFLSSGYTGIFFNSVKTTVFGPEVSLEISPHLSANLETISRRCDMAPNYPSSSLLYTVPQSRPRGVPTSIHSSSGPFFSSHGFGIELTWLSVTLKQNWGHRWVRSPDLSSSRKVASGKEIRCGQNLRQENRREVEHFGLVTKKEKIPSCGRRVWRCEMHGSRGFARWWWWRPAWDPAASQERTRRRQAHSHARSPDGTTPEATTPADLSIMFDKKFPRLFSAAGSPTSPRTHPRRHTLGWAPSRSHAIGRLENPICTAFFQDGVK